METKEELISAIYSFGLSKKVLLEAVRDIEEQLLTTDMNEREIAYLSDSGMIIYARIKDDMVTFRVSSTQWASGDSLSVDVKSLSHSVLDGIKKRGWHEHKPQKLWDLLYKVRDEAKKLEAHG